MARAKIGVEFNPVVTAKVDRELARLQSQAKGVDFGGGARSLNKLSRPLGKITGQANEFQKSLEASNARVLAFGASVVVINKLSEAFGALVSNTIKVEATFAKINTILGGSQKQLKQFGDGIFQVSKNTATAFDEVAEGALELARQGLSVEDSLARVGIALKLVRVAGIDSQKAVAGLTAAIKGFEGAGLTVAEIGDKLAEVDTKFAVSTEDLINGLERASASARVAGVSFDELLAAVTTVQERTQRGGAVIGNAFKTIFARLGRTDTLVALESLGISVLDAQGNVRDAVPLFRELAKELDTLGLRSVEAGEIIQKVAGVRQRDILINLVEDLNSEFSKFDQAIGVAGNSIGALDSKNAQLNQTLDSLIKKLVTSGQELASVLGNIGFLDAAKGIVDGFSAVVNKITDVLDGEGIGSKFARGLVAGIGSILTGPGLGLALAIFTKLFIDLAKFGVTSLKSLLGINAQTERQNALQQSVLQSLLQNEALQASLLKLGGDKAAQEQLLLRVYQQQVAAMSRLAAISKTVTPGLYNKGLRGGAGGVTGKASGGYIASEKRDVNRGVGGATSAAQVVSIPNFAFGGGKRGTMVANTSEYIVPNYAGGGDAIFNQNMAKSMGLPPGARKITAAGGYVPNFAIGTMPKGEVTRALGAKKMQNPTSPDLRNQKAQLLMRQRELNKGKKISQVPLGQFAMIVPQQGTNQLIQGAKGSSNEGLNYTVAGFKGLDAVKRGVKNDEQLDDELRQIAVKMAIRESKAISGRRPKAGPIRELANKGASSGLAGAIFETSVSSLLQSKDFDVNIDPNRRFDYMGGMGIDKLFNVPTNAAYIEAKLRNSPDQRNSMFGKMKKQLGRASSGYIPNYADPLSDAIGREAAAGVPINQIRINQSGKLRNSANPGGLAVTNTRDEPTGAIPNFVAPALLGFGAMLISSIASVVIPIVVDKTMRHMTSKKMIGPMQQGQNRPRVGGRGLGGNLQSLIGFGSYMAISGMSAFMGDPMGAGDESAPEKSLQDQVKALKEAEPIMKKIRTGTSTSTSYLGTRQESAIFSEVLDEGAMSARAQEIKKLEQQIKTLEDQEKAKRARVTADVVSRADARGSIISQFGQKARGIQGTAQVASAGGFAGGSVADAKAFLAINKELNNIQRVNLEYQIELADLGEKQKIQKITNLKSIADEAIAGKELGSIEKEKLDNLLESADANTDILAFTNELIGLLGEGFGEGSDAANKIIEKATVLNAKTEDQTKSQNRNLKLRKEEDSVLAQSNDKLRSQAAAQVRINKGLEDTITKRRLSLQLSAVGIGDLTGPAARAANVAQITGGAKIQKDEARLSVFRAREENTKKIAEIEKISASNRSANQVEELKFLKERTATIESNYQLQLDLIDKQTEYNTELAKLTPLQSFLKENQTDVDEFSERLPVAMAQNFETSMNSALNGLRDGTHDTIGEALGQVAINFGQAILQEFQSRAIKNATDALFSNSGGGSSFIGGLGNTVKNIFTRKNSGGMITGGSGVIDDVPAMLTGGEYVIKKSSVQKYGEGFLSQLNSGSIAGYNLGGSVQGGNNVRNTRFFDDTSGNMFGGAASNERLERARGMDFFTPGTRGFGAIAGKENLLAFSQQRGTSGSTDVISQGRIALELQSSRLTPLGRRLAMQSPSGQRLAEAQSQAYDLAMQSSAEEQRVVDENRQARKARLKNLQGAIASTAMSAALSVGAEAIRNSQIGNIAAPDLKDGIGSGGGSVSIQGNTGRVGGSVGGSVAGTGGYYNPDGSYQLPDYQVTASRNNSLFNFGRKNALGGDAGGTSNSLLTGGEFVMSAASASEIGKGTLDSINQATFALGGPVGSVASGKSSGSSAKSDVENINININIEKSGDADATASTSGGRDAEKAKEFSKKVKDVVLNVINEEKRVSGSLFTRNK